MCCQIKNVDARFIQFVSKHINLAPHSKIKLKDIFLDAWNDFLVHAKENNLVIRDVVLKEVDKLVGCGSLSSGYHTFVCTDCQEFIHCPFRCHSRFCPSCGAKTVLKKSEEIAKMLVNVKHRHLVFTIPAELRALFREHRKVCIDILFEAVRDTIYYIVKSSTPKKELDEDYAPGFISTLHTFGRDLKWNPHIHVILAECVSGHNKIFKKLFIPFEQIRKSFQFVLLKKLEDHFGIPQFRALKNIIYSHTEKGLYVYAKEDSCDDVKDSVCYVIRYHGKPAIAESRIISFENNIVTFWYDRHEDGKRCVESIHVFEFFKRLIVHIPDEYSNYIRYYGFYNKPIRQYKKLRKMYNPLYFKARECINSWRNMLRFYFDYDPLICKSCGKVMVLDSVTMENY